MADSSTGAPIVSNRPADDAFHQQRLKMWQPILSPMNVIIIFLVIGVAFIPSGIGLMGMSNSVYENEQVYDSLLTETSCSIIDVDDPRDVAPTRSCTVRNLVLFLFSLRFADRLSVLFPHIFISL